MALQNGNSNGTATQNSEDISNAAVHMTVVDETENMVNERRPSLTSRDSLDNEEDGKDNPAFEADVEASPEKPKNGKAPEGNHKEPSANGANKENVEMVPLNPAPQQNKKSNSAPANGSSNKNKDQTKVALDSMYTDYFRPVNTRRKLLRGEKLYVTRDQRAHSRSWKWFAFWGGVFTFIAAALLTGILAATGIIMSKSEPTSFASSNSLTGNFSGNDTLFDFGNEGMNASDASVTETHLDITSPLDIQHLDHEQKTESEPLSVNIETTESTQTMVSDLGNSLDENGWTSPHDLSLPEGANPWLSNDNITMTTASTTPFFNPTSGIHTMNSSVDETEQSTPERARSLDEEATLFPAINETLFPVINETNFPAINETIFPVENETTFTPVNETVFPAINETLTVPVINETLFPFINETIVPDINETLFFPITETFFPSINETVLKEEHNISSDSNSDTFSEDKFENATDIEIQDGDSIDVLNAANDTSAPENGTLVENSASTTTPPAENEFILQLTGSGKPRALFLPEDEDNSTAAVEGKETEFPIMNNVTSALQQDSTEALLDSVDDTIHLEVTTSTLEGLTSDMENSTSELLVDEEMETTTTQPEGVELMNSTDNTDIFSTSNMEDSTVLEDELTEEHPANSSVVKLNETTATGTEIPTSFLEGDEKEGKHLVMPTVSLTTGSLETTSVASSTTVLQSNSTASNSSELIFKPEGSSEPAIVSEESSEPAIVSEESSVPVILNEDASESTVMAEESTTNTS